MKKYIPRKYEIIVPGTPLHNTLYAKLNEKQAYDHWFIGVMTTKIACILGCKAGPPYQENVIFSTNLLDLLCHGLRECKVCKPLSCGAEKEVADFLDQIQQAEFPDRKLEAVNRAAQLWVEKNHQVDLSRYIRVKRINQLFKGSNPTYSGKINYSRYWTSLGMMMACFTEKGLCLLEFCDRLGLENELIRLQKKLEGNFKLASNHWGRQLGEELKEYFSGDRKIFNVPLHKIGSEFEQGVWSLLEKIPVGETRSYEQQAVELGKPTAIRAVANANGKNCISILVPCHRVIGKNGSLTGYGGGLSRKQFLLQHEKLMVSSSR